MFHVKHSGAAAPARPPAPMSAADCAAALDVSRETLDRLEAYVAVLRHWQRRRNLIGPGTVGDVWRRHILDCGQVAAHIPPGARRITDFGSGAGLPGLVLAIVTGLETDLIESDGAKAAFLAEAARLTGAPAAIHRGRIEALTPWPTDVLTARALAPLARLLDYAAPFLAAARGRPPLCIFHKGARWRQELTASADSWHMSGHHAPSVTDPDARVLVLVDVERARRPRGGG